MELPGSNYLLALATICITFVSVSTVAFVFRQATGNGLSQLEILLIRTFIRTGLGATIFSLLPLLLGLMSIDPSLVWRISSLLLALAHLNGMISYARGRAGQQQLASRTAFFTMFGISIAVIVGLLLNAAGIGVQPNVGLYALGATWILVQSMVVFVGAMRIFLDPMQKK